VIISFKQQQQILAVYHVLLLEVEYAPNGVLVSRISSVK